jgi:hypothetical protein
MSAPLLPFSGKCMLLPALVANDQALRELGWQPRHDGLGALADIIEREQSRASPMQPPPAQALTVITGAASGLGRAIAMRLSETGRRLVLVDRDRAALASVLPDDAIVRRRVCDLADSVAIEALCRELAGSAPPVLELFAAAGFGRRGPFGELSADVQAEMLTVNVGARLRLMHALLPAMRRHKWGRIVLISSSSAFQPLPGMAAYAASNAALLLLGEAVAAEVADDGIEVLTVCPGGMRTSFQKRAGVREIDGERLMAPEAVAEELLESLGKGRVTIMPSMRSKAMAALARVMPRRASAQLWGRLMRDRR